MHIDRILEESIFHMIKPQKAVLIYGSRRVGKTLLLEKLTSRFVGKTTLMNGEDFMTEQLLATRTITHYSQLFQGTDLLVIDEAQHIKDIGLILKVLIDHIKHLRILVSGSSSFDLFNQTGEPLVGRSYEYKLFPFSISELTHLYTPIELNIKLEELLIYGGYPELFSIPDYPSKQYYLNNMVNSYLLKDILMVDGIKNATKMRDLLRLVAFQVGNELSYDEVGKQLGLSRNTVEKYLDLLTKTFIIYKLPAFSRNPRKEISKMAKWYFYDNGIRNAIINDFRPIALRQDIGPLWEEFIISERIKFFNNRQQVVNFYFWRTYAGQEIDLIEEQNGEIRSFEFKWGKKQSKPPSTFHHLYPQSTYEVIHKENFLTYVL